MTLTSLRVHQSEDTKVNAILRIFYYEYVIIYIDRTEIVGDCGRHGGLDRRMMFREDCNFAKLSSMS